MFLNQNENGSYFFLFTSTTNATTLNAMIIILKLNQFHSHCRRRFTTTNSSLLHTCPVGIELYFDSIQQLVLILIAFFTQFRFSGPLIILFIFVQSRSHVRLFANPCPTACQASLSLTISQSLPCINSTSNWKKYWTFKLLPWFRLSSLLKMSFVCLSYPFNLS